MAPKKKALSFEEGLEKLETIATQMEKGELPLDELLKLYEEGMKLSGELNLKLEATSTKLMEIRLNQNGEPVIENGNITQQQSLLDGLVEE